MNANELTNYLYQYIPLAKASGVTITAIEPCVATAVAPISANHNPHQTAFGGSQYVVGLSCGWMLVYSWLVEAKLEGVYQLVIKNGNISYKKPIATELKATAVVDARTRKGFIEKLQAGNAKASFELAVTLNEKASTLNLELVAIKLIDSKPV